MIARKCRGLVALAQTRIVEFGLPVVLSRKSSEGRAQRTLSGRNNQETVLQYFMGRKPRVGPNWRSGAINVYI
jgi:hypothetical protein